MTTRKPTRATPRPKPTATHINIKDAARKRRERELDAAIERVRPAVERFNTFALANGIDPRELLTSKATAVWSGRSVSFTATPRAWIF